MTNEHINEKPSKEMWVETSGMIADVFNSSNMNIISTIDCFVQTAITYLYLQAREEGNDIKELQHGLKSILHDIVDIQLKLLDNPENLEKALSTSK